MKKLIVCLANSKKYGERCIAGIEVISLGTQRYKVVKDNDQPKWIRPVSNRDHGEISAELVKQIQLFDIVELEILAECPKGYQSENALLDNGHIKAIGKVKLSTETVDKFLSTNLNVIFLNRGKAVPKDKIDSVTNSLVFIKPDNVRFSLVKNTRGEEKLRSQFDFNGIPYDFPITDLDFLKKFGKKPDDALKYPNIYFTISLGVELDGTGWHYKLIAGITYF